MSTEVIYAMPDHNHHNGPICEQMAKYLAEQDYFANLCADPMNDYAGFVPDLPEAKEDECEHWSCQVMIHEDCIACEIEAQMEDELRHDMEESKQQRLHDEMIANDPDPFFGPF